MRYWWVNQNQTNRYEIACGYLWSPKVNRNGARNPFYEAMREVAPDDIVLSYFDGRVSAIGIVQSYGYEAPKPLEFGTRGAYWDKIGWRVEVAFSRLPIPLKPVDVMDVLAPLLPDRYAPLRPNGMGLQSVYLTRLPEAFARAVIDLIGPRRKQSRIGACWNRRLLFCRRSDWKNGRTIKRTSFAQTRAFLRRHARLSFRPGVVKVYSNSRSLRSKNVVASLVSIE